jgi:hypothetical protein
MVKKKTVREAREKEEERRIRESYAFFRGTVGSSCIAARSPNDNCTKEGAHGSEKV